MSQNPEVSQLEIPDWMISDEEGGEDKTDDSKANTTKSSTVLVDPIKLENLLKRRKVYGDLCQNATESQIERLLVSDHHLEKIVKI